MFNYFHIPSSHITHFKKLFLRLIYNIYRKLKFFQFGNILLNNIFFYIILL